MEGDTLRGLLGDRAGADEASLRERDGHSYLVVRNEFATVWLSLHTTGNGVRLQVTDAETETSIELDPLELEAISRMSHGDFDDRILERDPSVSAPPPRRADDSASASATAPAPSTTRNRRDQA